ncbi:MAG: PAP2 family protein, partial [Alphaproteobacteria bacterium]|nr:PAP2 family protein [Alphaproteobacteria bacterium]
FGIYAAAIMIGSVHLAWHYAIDGYLGALMAWGIWWLSGHLVRDVRT